MRVKHLSSRCSLRRPQHVPHLKGQIEQIWNRQVADAIIGVDAILRIRHDEVSSESGADSYRKGVTEPWIFGILPHARRESSRSADS